MQHNGIYYDGQTSQPHQAHIEVFGNSLSIYYDEKKVVWAISEIEYGSFSGKGKTMLQYAVFPHQYLEYTNDSSLAQALSGYLPKHTSGLAGRTKEYNAVLKAALMGIAIFSAIAAVIYFILLPFVASFIASKIPVSTEIALGEKFYESFIGDAEIDKEKTKLLNDFALKIDFETIYPLKFTVVKDNQVNAFALPGGNVVVFSGILDKIKSSEELAALLAHEVTHVKERHSLKGLARSLTGSLLISVIFGDMGSLGSVLASQADDIYQLGFSREMEKEADLEGLQLMYHNQLDPQGMIHLMERLHEEEQKQGSSKMLAYLNSHPMTDDRITYIRENSAGKTGTAHKELDSVWEKIENTVDNKY
ncbi:M48 family metallopeptidase [Emticicia agri]|uniref:M48 family metallopeptidase n=1 Tax=Emticicia agri TaxID=2492393 RepID=A0A4Q5LTY1_9BACT|nr:M48 family metallopeptidase [Emticicia agri]RYU93101.1 M48 family metallopeptidase [Emticicia agri]